MTRRNLRPFCLLLLAFVPLMVLAQPKLRITYVSANPEDTTYYPGTPVISYTMVVQNVGNNQLTGACNVRFMYNTSTNYEDRWSWQASNFEVGQTDTLRFNDTITGLTGSRHKGGDNIIVIWPHTDNPNAQIPDTTRDSIYIVNTNAAHDPVEVASRVELFPNPSNSTVKLRFVDRKHPLEYVRILALDGRVVYSAARLPEEIDLSTWSSGLYLVEFRFKDGVHGAVRLRKD